MAFSIALQKQQHPGGGAIAEYRFENRIHGETGSDSIRESNDPRIESYYTYVG